MNAFDPAEPYVAHHWDDEAVQRILHGPAEDDQMDAARQPVEWDYGEFGHTDEDSADEEIQQPIDINLPEFYRHMLLANFLQRRDNTQKLINTQDFAGDGIHFTEELNKSDLIFFRDRGFGGSVAVAKTSRGKKNLVKSIPIVQYLSFNGYRLVGGACLSALRRSAHQRNGEHFDLDLFPLVGEMSSRIEKEAKAQEIYKQILTEIDTIIRENFLPDTYKTFILRNEGCTTIHLRRQGADVVTIQIVHRAFETELQMLTSADLIPSQILYDGTAFFCTYPAMLALRTNSFPVDVSAASCSMGFRIRKYIKEKRFTVVLCGMNRSRIGETFKSETASQEDEHKNAPQIILPIGICVMAREDMSEFFCDSLGGRQEKRIADVVTAQGQNGNPDFGIKGLDLTSVSDYDAIESRSGSTLGFVNLTNFFEGRVSTFSVCEKSILAFLSDPKIPDMTKSFRRAVDMHLELTRSATKLYYGEFAENAWLTRFREDDIEHEKLIEKRLEQIIAPMNEQAEKLKIIKWRIDNPGQQGSMQPVRMPARSFYTDFGDNTDEPFLSYYNGFHCTSDWPAKLTIIIAWKKQNSSGGARGEESCLLAWVPKDVLKRIFFFVDLDHVRVDRLHYYKILFRESAEKKIEQEVLADAWGPGIVLRDLRAEIGFDRFDDIP